MKTAENDPAAKQLFELHAREILKLCPAPELKVLSDKQIALNICALCDADSKEKNDASGVLPHHLTGKQTELGIFQLYQTLWQNNGVL